MTAGEETDAGYSDGHVEVAGLRLHYVEWGDAASPPLVLLHGLGDCARSWDRLAAAMRSKHRVIALDHRGHGDSDWGPRGAYGAHDYVSDVEALTEGLGLPGFVLLGHSEGGRTGIEYAARHPGNVEALVVVEANLGAGGAPPDKLPESPRAWTSLDEVVGYLRTRQPDSADDILAHQALHLTKELPDGGRTWRRDPAVLDAYERTDLWPEWRSLRCPVLVVRGRQSGLFSHQDAVKMRETAQWARIAELEGGGQWIHQEFPGAFEATVRWFLQNPPS